MSDQYFYVGIREVHVSTRKIKAPNGPEALRRYVDGEDEGDEVMCEYSHTLDPETFTVEPAPRDDYNDDETLDFYDSQNIPEGK